MENHKPSPRPTRNARASAKREVVLVQPLSSLKLNRRNARTHSPRQIRQIADSIRAFGFNNPILVDKNNLIAAGHGRAKAAKLLGMTEVPTVRLSHMTEAQMRAYVIADNRLAEKAGWDDEILAIEFQNFVRDRARARPDDHWF